MLSLLCVPLPSSSLRWAEQLAQVTKGLAGPAPQFCVAVTNTDVCISTRWESLSLRKSPQRTVSRWNCWKKTKKELWTRSCSGSLIFSLTWNLCRMKSYTGWISLRRSWMVGNVFLFQKLTVLNWTACSEHVTLSFTSAALQRGERCVIRYCI